MHLVTWVQFRGDERPSVWRDICNHVTFEWAVAVGDRDPGSEPEVLTLQDCRAVALEGRRATNTGKASVITRENGTSVWMTKEEAQSILVAGRERALPPEKLGSFTLLKAGLGAMPRVVLDKKVQSFFDDPETGIIRAKDVPVPEKLSNAAAFQVDLEL
ncbi:SWR1 [Symbiodinium natans]|uniref:SWR1 protein n=1 Tax=Symbiodinium natans TaxID=878477 RepID=A0A812TVG7_9DINO|nr:SWR1 [Symbiodinium natans]